MCTTFVCSMEKVCARVCVPVCVHVCKEMCVHVTSVQGDSCACERTCACNTRVPGCAMRACARKAPACVCAGRRALGTLGWACK